MKSRTLFLFLIFLFMLAACNPATPVATPESTEAPPPSSEEPFIKPTDEPENVTFTPDWLKSLPPQTILLQQDYEPTFFRIEAQYEFGREPVFVLYADGTLIYGDEGETYDQLRVMSVQLSAEETVALLEQVMNAGFQNLESHTDFCFDQPDGQQMCMMDASFTILRVIQSDGTLREVKIYAEFANDLMAFETITGLLRGYTHPDAQMYVPENATLFLRQIPAPTDIVVQTWPLSAEVLTGLVFPEESFVPLILSGQNLADFLNAVPRNFGDFFFELEGTYYSAYFVPWLPGADYTVEIEQAFPLEPVPFSNPEVSPNVFANCPVVDTRPLDSLRLAYTMDGDVWVWDDGTEPISLTGTSDITSAALSPSGNIVLYTRQLGENTFELWASNADGSNPRLLAGGDELTGSIVIGTFSFDEALVTFTHSLPDGGGELWVANVDGSGARLLVSQEELMSIITEPAADYATPTAVTWIPNTYTLIYDAYPVFKADGIYIFIQQQNWMVDALTGEKSETIGNGSISYSPDGTVMMVTSPTSLQFANGGAKDLHDAGLEYFAVGAGEYYAHPALAWSADSQYVLIAQPVNHEFPLTQSEPVIIWQVPVDGSPATKLLEVEGFFPSFDFSPGLDKVAYWRSVQPQSNDRELHVAALDGSQHVVYDAANTLEFLGWSVNGQHFVYGSFANQQAFVGDACGQAVPLGAVGLPVNLRWIDAGRFLFERWSEDSSRLEVYLGAWFGESELKLNLKARDWYDYALIEG
jgi:hypothetical protein